MDGLKHPDTIRLIEQAAPALAKIKAGRINAIAAEAAPAVRRLRIKFLQGVICKAQAELEILEAQ